MIQKQIEKMALIERNLRLLIQDRKVKGKIVIFVDPENEKEGYIERVECIIVDKF